MVTTTKVENASPNTGVSCRSGRNGSWLRPTSVWALLTLFCVGINIDAEAATFGVDSTVDAAYDCARKNTNAKQLRFLASSFGEQYGDR